MKLLTPQMLLDTIVDDWKHQNPLENDIIFNDGKKANDILRQLEELGPLKTAKQVNKIIGRISWTATKCYECDRLNIPIAIFSEPLIEIYDNVGICEDCLNKTMKLFK